MHRLDFLFFLFLHVAWTSTASSSYRVLSSDGTDLQLSPVQLSLVRTRRETKTPSSTTNSTVMKDNHLYYKSSIIIDKDTAKNYMHAFRKDFKTLDYKTHKFLSWSHRSGLQIKISFDFLFYGHKVNKVTITTGGFLYVSDFLHKYLAFSQYIAPLMADFHLGLGSGDVKWVDTGSALIVMWEDVQLHKHPEYGNYTFEVIVFKNGTIVFGYYSLPTSVERINRVENVTVGLSDAYYYDFTDPITGTNWRRIVEYHRVSIDKKYIANNTVVILHPLPTCIQQATCDKCLSAKTPFSCSWCSRVGHCSSGTDRMKQKWEANSCHKVKKLSSCGSTTSHPITSTAKTSTPRSVSTPGAVSTPRSVSTPGSVSTPRSVSTPGSVSTLGSASTHRSTSTSGSVSISRFVSISGSVSTQRPVAAKNLNNAKTSIAVSVILIVVLAVCVALGVWVFYAYRRPSSPSGRWLIENRPSVLISRFAAWRRGRASTRASPEELYGVESTA